MLCAERTAYLPTEGHLDAEQTGRRFGHDRLRGGGYHEDGGRHHEGNGAGKGGAQDGIPQPAA